MNERRSGLLLHPTSLPSRCGVGDIGPEAERFLDWAASAGQTVWQVLPLGPPGFHGSPYDNQSSFAGNPLLISPDRLREDDLLDEAATREAPVFPADRCDFEATARLKREVFRRAHRRLRDAARPALREEFEAFRRNEEQRAWLHEWSLFSALKERFQMAAWTEWDRPWRIRETKTLDEARKALSAEIEYHEFVQFLFFRQWGRLRQAAARRGVLIMGDVPIYPALDSAEVWASPQLFSLGSDGLPTCGAGVPPDYFSPTGQLWGNPTYRWDRHEEEGFSWWIARVRASLRFADFFRIDHFRGFVDYWEVPAGETTAIGGQWRPGPGERLFRAIREALGDLPLVAEDLGEITEPVRQLRDALGLPGMSVLQFAFSSEDSEHLPSRHTANAVVYTGTHDNDTTRGWFENLPAERKERALRASGGGEGTVVWDLMQLAAASPARLAIFPLQDVFDLGSEARMNTPGRADGNWSWRARAEMFTPERAASLRALAEETGRLPARAATGAPLR